MLEVIGAGFGRTGTHSLASALATLGFGPCYSMLELSRNPSHLSFWQEAMDGKPVDWERFFRSYQSTVEWPAVSFLSKIMTAFPQAKVILTLREPEAWFESANATIFEGLEFAPFNPNPAHRQQGILAKRLILERGFSSRHRERERAISVYQEHIEYVTAMVDPERLLQYRITEGWEPLCAFLGVEQPIESFPWVHERSEFMSTEPEWARQARDEWAGKTHKTENS